MKAAPRIAVWRAPIWLAGLTMYGLLVALLGGGAWRWPACVALAFPIVVGAWHALRRHGD